MIRRKDIPQVRVCLRHRIAGFLPMTSLLKFLRHQLGKNAQACLGCRQSESDTRRNKWNAATNPLTPCAICPPPCAEPAISCIMWTSKDRRQASAPERRSQSGVGRRVVAIRRRCRSSRPRGTRLSCGVSADRGAAASIRAQAARSETFELEHRWSLPDRTGAGPAPPLRDQKVTAGRSHVKHGQALRFLPLRRRGSAAAAYLPSAPACSTIIGWGNSRRCQRCGG